MEELLKSSYVLPCFAKTKLKIEIKMNSWRVKTEHGENILRG